MVHSLFLNCLQVVLWDTGGLERYDSMTANYYRNAHAVLLVYDLGDPDTLYSLNEWVDEAKKNNRWSDRLVFAMLGNDRRQRGEYTIEDEAIEAFGSKHGIDPRVNCKVSVHDNNNVQRVFKSIIKFVDDKFTNLGEGDPDQLPEDTRDTAKLAFSMSDGGSNRDKARCSCPKR